MGNEHLEISSARVREKPDGGIVGAQKVSSRKAGIFKTTVLQVCICDRHSMKEQGMATTSGKVSLTAAQV